MKGHVRSGLEVLATDSAALLAGRRFALLANQAAVTRDLAPGWVVLSGLDGVLVRLFSPEHGLWGTAQDMEAVGEASEPATGLPVRSLYGSSPETFAPRKDVLDDLDAVVVDLPDIGTRYYTFAATMAHVMAACARAGVEVIVCDRPNPIGGEVIEGGPIEPGLGSFVSEIPVPVRHGLTLGELALWIRAARHPDLSLTVVPCEGWTRAAWWDETGLPWVAPSPNMPTPITAAIYPGGCLLESTNVSEGRGTTRPFQLMGAPWLDGNALAARLNALELPGSRFRACRFRPEFQKWAGRTCGGVEWHVTDRLALRPLEAGVSILREVRALDPERFAWRTEPYEYVADVPALDLLTGSAQARAVVEGRAEAEPLFAAWRAWGESFRRDRTPFLLYPA
jgi:uncharacterized protein YbbC (DUF1343 family)